MSSFLSKRLQEQQRKEKKPVHNTDNLTLDDEDSFDDDLRLEEPPPKAKQKPKAKSKLEEVAPSAAPVQAVGNLDAGETLDTGYVVPPKRRTTPSVKKLRQQLRSKLLAFPDEADTWSRGDVEKEQIIPH